ncbi:alpha/beta hydrolase family protein [Nocardia sp. NPDC050712]|uniref:alpha/beta hydrolase n=1 Tax=Nocardia sp. NPDC050712 TaxID=3155518 RepID=UPI0033D8B105
MRKPSSSAIWSRRLELGTLAAVAALLFPLGAAMTIDAPTARAGFDPAAFDFWVDSPVMGPIKTRVLRARDGNTQRVVYALDGMRAPETLSGWEIETGVPALLADWNINVVMPVGGMSSFYADWNAPSSFSDVGSSSGSGGPTGPGKSYRYDWETFLTRDLRNALNERLGFNSYRNGVFGLSMGGSAALTLAAYHPDQFSFAGSMSGFLNISAPGMREALRIGMIDAGGYNVDSMAPPWGPSWLRMDPFVFAPNLVANGTRLWIASGSGLPMDGDIHSALDVIQGMPLEGLALANTRAFQVRMDTLGGGNAFYSYPAGIHNWHNWIDEAARMAPDLSANIG